MKIWNHVQNYLPDWFSNNETNTSSADTGEKANPVSPEKNGDTHLGLAKESLNQLLNDDRVPESVRESLQADYQLIRQMLEKLEQGQLHIAVFGRVSVRGPENEIGCCAERG